MRVLRDFKCDGEHVTERFIDSEVNVVPCETCGKKAYKTLGLGNVMLDGTDPGFPGAWDKWATIRERRHRQLMTKKQRDGM